MRAGPVVEIVADGNPGGGTTAVLGLCEDLRTRLDRDIVLVTQRDSYAFRQGEALGLRVHGLDFFRARFDPALKAQLATLMRVENPVLIHAHGGRAANAMIGGARSCPLVYTVHGYHFPAKPALVRPLFRLAEARMARHADHIVFVSESDRRIAAENRLICARTRCSVIRNGIDAGQLGPNEDVARDDVMVFLSRMHRQKNPRLAIEMMAHLRDIPVRLLMIGGGALEADMRALVARLELGASVHILGALPRSDALAHLRKARAMVFPSLWEGLPIAPMEALYFGVPVVASHIPGTDEVVQDGHNGLLVENPAPETMAAAVRRLLGDATLWARLAENGRKDARTRFARAANSDTHAALYGELGV